MAEDPGSSVSLDTLPAVDPSSERDETASDISADGSTDRVEDAPRIDATSGPAPSPGAGSEVPRRRPRRWLKWLRNGAAVAVLIAVSLVLLVRWSIAEHDRLMFEATDQNGLVTQELFTRELLGGKHNQYRLPAIIRATDGTLVAFAEGRRGDDDFSGIELVSRRSKDDGETWSGLETIAAAKGFALGSPTPVLDHQTGTLWLAYRRTHRVKGDDLRSTIAIMKSDDAGQTWAAPIDLNRTAIRPASMTEVPPFLTVGPGHGIQLEHGEHKGRLVISTSWGHENKGSVERREVGASQTVYSDDHGSTWRFGETTDYGSENALVETLDGAILMILRTRAYSDSKRMKRIAWSRDGGETWSPTEESTELREPVCQQTLLRHPAGNPDGSSVLLFLSPDAQAKGRWDKSARRDLSVWVSTDEGQTWPIKRQIHAGGASYSDATVTPDGRVHVVYEVGISKKKSWGGAVRHTSFAREWIHESLGVRPSVPMSEKIYEAYQWPRARIEEWKHGKD